MFRARRSLDELRGALGAAEHLRALVGRGKLVLVAAVGRARRRGRGGGRRGPRAQRRRLLGAVRAVDLAGLLGHRRQQLLRALVRGPQRQRPLLEPDLVL